MESAMFDAVVIGAGQGGVPLCRALAEQGWKLALVERRFVGGVCTNDGCTPTKTMVALAKTMEQARRAERFRVRRGPAGVEPAADLVADLGEVMAYTDEVVRKSRHAMERSLGELDGLELVYGEASFAEEQPVEGVHAITVRLREGGERTLQSTRVFLDVGERPEIPQVEGLESVPYLDSSSLLALQTLPEHLVILGGGYISVEFAQIFRRFGAAVTIVERGPQLVAKEDEDIASCFAGILREDGIDVELRAEVRRISGTSEQVLVHFEREGQERTVRGSHLLVATGRRPNTETLHLERVGVAVDERGYVPVDERLRTEVPGIWAMGDVTGGPPYTHIAYDDFRVLRSQLLGDGQRVTAGRPVPYCIFTDPELGRVGLSERQAREAGLNVRIARAEMKRVARAHEMDNARGMMKAVVDRATGKIVGAAILGVNGGEVATELELAMMGGLDYEAVRESIFTHPVLAEGLHLLFRNLED